MSFADAAHLRTYDRASKDLARCSLLVPRDYIYFLDKTKLLAKPWPELLIPEGYGKNTMKSPKKRGEIDGSTGENAETPDLPPRFAD